ncbi:hypothetical protein C2S52_017044 [Perilla frutescens var. hirtella]|nr:hypothetical protein C2S52_017044 [Perilla frutescens var. hirtella]
MVGKQASGYVAGPFGQESMVCQFIQNTNSQGSTWFGGNPFSYTVPLLFAQISIIFLVTSLVWFLIRPCKQGLISAQLIGGIIMGQSFLGRIKAYRDHLFPPGGRQILETSADLGFIFYLFILGVHIDLNLVKKVERYAVVIGGLNFVVPLLAGFAGVHFVDSSLKLDDTAQRSLPLIASLTAMSSFPVITSVLADLNILNSEIGRIATLASLVSDIFNYSLSMMIGAVGMYVISQESSVVMSAVGALVFLLIILLILRPILNCVARRVGEGQQMKESHFVVISVVVLLCAFGSEILGQPSGLGTFILGVVVPDAAGLGSNIVSKLDALTTGLLVPAKFVISGLSMDMFSIKPLSAAAYLVILFLGYSAKFLVVFITALYYKIPSRDATALALVLCCKGAIEAALYITLFEDGMLGRDAYAILLISMLTVTGLARPLIAHLYDPSSRYIGLCKNSIMLNQPNDELRMLVCIHNADNVPTIINLLDASTPMRDRPITLFALNLMELKGKGAAILEQTDRKTTKLTTSRSWSNQAANAINAFAERNQASVVVRHFTSVAPYASMHDDVCTLAADQVTNIVIVPFHKQYTTDSAVASNSPSMRLVNQNVMAKSPCSVGILIDRGQISTSQYVQKGGNYHVCLLFLGGMDDCEALAYCTRFIHNQMVNLTLFRAKTMGNDRVIYKEELVKDAIGTTRVIGSIKDYDCDICVVGRYHDPDSEILAGINEWSECPELGIIGDMLATPDFQFSVLVVQQQPPGMDFAADGTTALQTVASGYITSSRYSDCKDDFDSFHRV